MNEFVNEVTRNRLNRTKAALEANNFEVYVVADRTAAREQVKALIPKGASIGVGGSETLNECDILSLIRNGDYSFIDRYEKGLSPDEMRARHVMALGADFYISGTNAVFTPSHALFRYVTEIFPKPHAMQSNIDTSSYEYHRIKSIVCAVFSEYMNRVSRHSARLNNNAITKLLVYLNEHFTEDIDLDKVSEELGYNKTYLSRCIRAIPGVNFRKLINSLRVDLAKNLLSTTDFTILTIAIECGFTNERTLQRVFSEMVGVTPREYRIMKKEE